ncbi:MAG: TrkA C-terminal domain-containing protein [Acholeplasmatales bacterium]|nr:TrkA C-terminal domain-containing protein [Acholeplasmatales bacterium]
MNIILAIILILGFILAYIIIIGIFTTLFRATGLTKGKSRYQAISLFTNCGFTTSESELITSNKTRRRLATLLMIIGHVFSVIIVSLVVALFSSLNFSDVKSNIIIIAIVIAVFFGIVLVFNLPFVSKPIQKLFENLATKRVLKKSKNNIITVLDNYGKQSLVEIYLYWVPSILNDKSLLDAGLKRNYDLNLITIKRKNKIVDVNAETIIQKMDKIIIFGNIEVIEDIFKNRKDKKEENKMDVKNKISIIDNYGKDAMCEIEIHDIPDILFNTPLGESIIKSKYEITIIMVKHGKEHNLTTAQTVINNSDTLIVFGPYQNIKEIFRSESEIKVEVKEETKEENE